MHHDHPGGDLGAQQCRHGHRQGRAGKFVAPAQPEHTARRGDPGLAAGTAIAVATSVYLRYDADLAGGNTSHILSGGVRLIW